ncbi:TIGR04283 family arsenosugar biosynthesis glycosyltransferase [Psychroflexus sp. CAK8W]|uniref:TIGR04283 family arsenosugar biosynthesis glycosyltransferase n=1 Tax=Psychroflexus longus TaxID=2873596 RepID=A0ABS7XG33_9FLAO|nr:TIGR04283 family arsenosugar biosynthesis glycosyltransferase [Psychroflexus longus]MBZ9777379.1 TIGR04283 family arsenosugar biosynthesis glycosyltransferase [Psychroflexus longus]
MLISIIIPALNEEKLITEVLKHTLKLPGHYEVIVVDGGSLDKTLEIVQKFKNINVLQSKKGRAVQMNYGAGHAKGDVFLFLHADTFLPKTFYNDVLALMQNPKVIGGSFRLKMDDSHPIFKFYRWCSQFSLEFFTYGDHGMFFKAENFQNINGYKNIDFMEDVEIQKRIRKHGLFKKLKSSVQTSNRRFAKKGVIKQLVIDTLLVFFFKIGISARRLKRFYPDN